MQVVFFIRKAFAGQFSIENAFEQFQKDLPKDIDRKIIVSRYHSKGIWKRLYNCYEVWKNQGAVNHVVGDNYFVTFGLKKKTTLTTIYDCNFLHRTKGIKRLLLKYFWLTLPVQRSRYISVISEATKAEVIQYTQCPSEKVKVIPVPLQEGFVYRPKPVLVKPPTLLHIGITENKNLIRLAEALENLPCHLLIVGKLNALQKETLEKCKIQYTNEFNISQQRIIELYRKCDILTFVSTYEGFGLPIIEAQATGRAVVTSQMPPMSTIAGGAACLVDPYDVNNIRKGIERVLTDEEYRKELIQKGLENVKQYSSTYVAKQFYKIYQELHASQ